MGRIFTEAEEAPGHRLVVISDGVWRTHLGGQASAIGSSLRLNGEPYEVIGVMPRGFQFPWRNNGVWVPFAMAEQDRQRGSHSFWVAARMKPDVTFESARAEIEQIGRALQQRYEENADEGATITLMADQGLGTLRTMLTALMGAVSLVLPHRLRQCRQPAARARAVAAARICDAHLARRRSSAAWRGSCSWNRWCSPWPAASARWRSRGSPRGPRISC